MNTPSNEYNPAVLYGKLARITQKMTRIRKTGRHPQGYQFATETDIIESVREAMADENISLVANMVGYQITDGGLTKAGAAVYHTVCEFEFIFVCADSGTTVTCKWFNESLDSSDKGFNKAATAALKYFLMKTFLITTGEPDEHESSDVQTTKKQPQKAVSPPAKNATNGQPGANPVWFDVAVGEAWTDLKAYLLETKIYTNDHEMKNSMIKRGIVANNNIVEAWKHKLASELVAFLKTRHEEKQTA